MTSGRTARTGASIGSAIVMLVIALIVAVFVSNGMRQRQVRENMQWIRSSQSALAALRSSLERYSEVWRVPPSSLQNLYSDGLLHKGDLTVSRGFGIPSPLPVEWTVVEQVLVRRSIIASFSAHSDEIVAIVIPSPAAWSGTAVMLRNGVIEWWEPARTSGGAWATRTDGLPDLRYARSSPR